MSSPEPFDPYALSADSIQEPPATLGAALRKIGPGIILAGSIIGSGELLLTTSLGAEFGFIFLWLILFSCVIKVFVQIELGRYAISSGKPTLSAFDALPGPRLGTHLLVWWWFIMMLATISQLGAMAGGVGQALHLAFPNVAPGIGQRLETLIPEWAAAIEAQPERPWAILTGLVAIALLASGGYRRIEKLTTIMVAMVTAITVACVLALPKMGYTIGMADIREGFSLGVLGLSASAVAAAFGTFGITGVGASELFAYPYWCIEKGYARYAGPRTSDADWARRARGWVRVLKLDAWVSMVVFTVATVSFYCLGATVLHRQHLMPHKQQMISTLSQMYVPAFGAWTQIVFLVGVWAVLFKTLYVASASYSRLTADFLSLTGAVRYQHPDDRTRTMQRLCVLFPLVGVALYLWVGDPKAMVIFGGFFQAATLPIIGFAAIYLRYRRTDPRLAPSGISDACLWFAVLAITAVALYAVPHWLVHDAWPAVRGAWSELAGL